MWRWKLTLRRWCFVACALWMGMPGCLAPRLITLDSTNTLLRLRRPVGELYLQRLSKVPGVAVSADDLTCRCRVAIARQSQRSPSFGAAEQGCQAWWRKVVAETLEGAGVGADHKDFEGTFQHLYDLFAGQEAWELFPHTRSTLDSLRHWCSQNSCRLGVLSNMDDRLEMILEQLEIRDCFDFVLTSYAAGAEKPSSEIFTKAMACGEVLEPQHCLHCGDSKKRDLHGALRSGWCAALLDETAKRTAVFDCFEDIGMAGPLSVHQSAWKMPDLSHLPGEGLEDPALTVPAARQIIAEQLKLQARQVVLFETGLLSDTDALPDGLIQIYIQEIKVSMEEFLAKARKKPADCSELLRLNVMANLSALPTDVGEWFPALTHLFLTNNHISHCPESIGNLQNLTEFDFDGNQLADLPESFQQLTALQQLKLDRNQFQEIPEGILCLENLKELSMCSNQLSKLPGLGQLTALERLAMAKNQIRSVWPGLERLRNLKELTLAQNQLETLPDVFNLPQLKHLDVSFNQLTMLPDSIVTATSLKELLVNHNRLSFLPHHIGNLSQLKDLNLNANVLRFLPESFAALAELQNVWLDKGQMTVLPESSRSLLRVAATLYTSLEGEELPTGAKAAAAPSPPRKKTDYKAERIRGIFQSFDLNGDGVIDFAELRFVLRSIRDVGSALSDEMIEEVLQQMDANKDGLVNFEEFLSWLYAQRPSTEKQLLRRAVGILEAEGAQEPGAAEVERPQMGPPSLTWLSSRALAEEARDALKALKEEELEELHSHPDAKVRGLLEVLSLLLAGMVPGTPSAGPLAGAESLMKQPRYFLSACDSVLSWIDEGKLPEQNVESARAVKNSLPWHFLPEVVAKSVESTAAICLCKWMVAIFAYFDAVENWEP